MNIKIHREESPKLNLNKASQNTRNMIESYLDLEDSIQSNFGKSLLSENSAMADEAIKQRCADFFIEESYDPEDFEHDQDKINNFVEAMKVKFENNLKGVSQHLYESAGTNAGLGLTNLNAITGLSLPLSKMILMNNMFLNTMNVMVSDSKIITKDFEIRYLVDPNTGKRIDISKQQDQIFNTMYNANPNKELELLPNTEIDAVEQLGLGATENIDRLVVRSITVEVELQVGDVLPDNTKVETAETRELDLPIGFQLNESYNGPSLSRDIIFNGRNLGKIFIGRDKNKISFMAMNDKFKNAKILCFKDNSNFTDNVPRVEWELKKQQVSIDHQIALSTAYTLQLQHDYKSLHDVDLLSTIVESSKTVLDDYKDSYINKGLDKDFERALPNQKVIREVDFASKQNFTGTSDQWIESTFRNSFDEVVDALIRIVNDPNVEVLVYGRPIIIEKVLPKDANGRITDTRRIGNQAIEYAKATVTTAGRKANFISSQKLQTTQARMLNNELKLLLNPTNDRTMYTIAEYQTYLGTAIKTAQNAHLPCVTGFDRFELLAFEGVQGRMPIHNVSGIRQGETDATIDDLNTTVAGVERQLRPVMPE